MSTKLPRSRGGRVVDLSIMGWSLFRLLHLFCAMTAMAGVRPQGDGGDIHNQPFEEEAMYNMMRAWEKTGTSPDVFKDWQWHFEHFCPSYRYSWSGVFCSIVSYQPENSSLIYYNNVVEISFYYNEPPSITLVGELPPAITNLTNLERLFISNASKLSGPLPTGLFCSSEVLRSIELPNCSFNGSISSGFDGFDGSHGSRGSPCYENRVLERLDLSRNNFTKMSTEMSPDTGFYNFNSLLYLDVSHNQIQGEFIVNAYALEFVDISNNFITNITSLLPRGDYLESLKSIYAQNNLISTFPIENLYFESLENIILDSNKITGELHMPNISCQYSRIKLISLLNNNITHFYPSNDTTSCFSESSILLDEKIFLFGNPICASPKHKTKLLRHVCRTNATSPIQVENVTIFNKLFKIIIPCVSGVVLAIFIIGFFVIQKLKKKISLLHEIQSEFDKRDVKPNLYSFSELKVATQDFHIRNELGRGGFGIVYKGVLPDGSHVAVKKLTKLSMEQGIQDFLSEIIVVSNIKHRNLVQLKGCCIKENQRILVHEFVENKNLEDALWGDSRSNGDLDWPTRFNIILGIARGLAYLHEDVRPAIVHRDIKGENILLDKHWNPKIADFGLALFYPSFDDGETHMSVSTVAGTKGYMAPEYLCYGQVSTKLDVFSFGVLLLEIVSGRKKIDLKSPATEQYLVQWAQELHSNDNLPNLKDKSLEEMTMVEVATFKKVVKVGLQCLHHIAARRPTMSEVVAMLTGNKNVDDCALEDYDDGSNSLYDVGSCNFRVSAPNSSLQCVANDDNDLHPDSWSHEQSPQLCEVELLILSK